MSTNDAFQKRVRPLKLMFTRLPQLIAIPFPSTVTSIHSGSCWFSEPTVHLSNIIYLKTPVHLVFRIGDGLPTD